MANTKNKVFNILNFTKIRIKTYFYLSVHYSDANVSFQSYLEAKNVFFINLFPLFSNLSRNSQFMFSMFMSPFSCSLFFKKNLLDHLCMGMWSYEAFQALAGQKIIFLFCLIETLGRDRILSICPKLSPLKNFRKYYSIIPCSEKSLILMRKC